MNELNVNTRFINDNITEFAKELLTTFPPELNRVYMVNSGSEANDLALRLSRNYAKAKDFIIVDHGYHGHTTEVVKISELKFNCKGGEGI